MHTLNSCRYLALVWALCVRPPFSFLHWALNHSAFVTSFFSLHNVALIFSFFFNQTPSFHVTGAYLMRHLYCYFIPWSLETLIFLSMFWCELIWILWYDLNLLINHYSFKFVVQVVLWSLSNNINLKKEVTLHPFSVASEGKFYVDFLMVISLVLWTNINALEWGNAW